MKASLIHPILAIVFVAVSPASAAIILFDLEGKAGGGLLPGNENGTVLGTPGTGGLIGSGISFNDETMILSIQIGWGSSNGFTNLTGNATAGHIHGPTLSGGPASFLENAGVLIGLDDKIGWDSSGTSGGFNGSVTLNSTQAAQLMNGQLYINVHTSTNQGGEIRGNLVVIPEPSVAVLASCAACFACRRRRR